MLDLHDVVAELDAWSEGKGVILNGSNRTFCSGGDLETVRNILNSEDGYKMSQYMQEVTTRFLSLPMVTVALVEGVALGGGAELVTACDFSVMTEQARIGFVQIKMGVTTGWGGGTRLTKLVGRKNALQIMCSGRIYDALTCQRMGLVDEVFPETENALEMTKSWLTEYCAKDSVLVRNFKTIASRASSETVDDALSNERLLFSQTWGGALQQAALNKNIKH